MKSLQGELKELLVQEENLNQICLLYLRSWDMKSNYNQLGQYIEMVSRTNSDLKYGIEDVRGCSNTKQMMQTRANLIGRTYEKFIVLRPQEFVFNRRTTRNGEKSVWHTIIPIESIFYE